MMDGTAPGCGAEAIGLLYPHPETSIASNKTEVIFILFSPVVCCPPAHLAQGKSRECHDGVIFL